MKDLADLTLSRLAHMWVRDLISADEYFAEIDRRAPLMVEAEIRGERARRGMVVSEPVTIPSRPSDEYIQQLRDMGASQETINRALGIRPPHWWVRVFRRQPHAS